jgi:hypothetical protein
VLVLQHATHVPLARSQQPPAQSASALQPQSDPHCRVTTPQHWPALQSPVERQHGLHAPPMQHVPGPQSASAQHAAHTPSAQHLPPLGHGAPGVHGQSIAPHWRVLTPQHCPAVQSPLERQHALHAPPMQHFPAPH